MLAIKLKECELLRLVDAAGLETQIKFYEFRRDAVKVGIEAPDSVSIERVNARGVPCGKPRKPAAAPAAPPASPAPPDYGNEFSPDEELSMDTNGGA